MRDPKYLEIRDRATCIPVLAFRIGRVDGFLPRRAGYGDDLIMLMRIEGGEVAAYYDPFGWPHGFRTMKEAHLYIRDNYDQLKDHDVVDVEFILGETKEKKVSERFTAFTVAEGF